MTPSPHTSHPPLRIATRESRLALWQAQHVQALLLQQGHQEAVLLGMTTRGDQIVDRSLAKVGGKGRADLAVHSLKDVPMDLPEGFCLAAVLARHDPRDALVSPGFETLADLPAGARVGTSSLRRVVQLRALRPDLHTEPLRGNLDTRLRKLDAGQFEAIILAAAGLQRLGLGERIRSLLPPEQMLPCAGQGALAIEVCSDAHDLRARLQSLVHLPTWLAVHAERAVSRDLGGSCSMPLAAYAHWQGAQLQLRAVLGQAGATPLPLLQASAQAAVVDVDGAQALGAQVVASLRAQGAAEYLR
jgi:hydroxymethylbilane synthase